MSDINLIFKGPNMKRFLHFSYEHFGKEYCITVDTDEKVITVDEYTGSDRQFDRLMGDPSVAPRVMNWWGYKVNSYIQSSNVAKLKARYKVESYLKGLGLIQETQGV